MAAVTRASRVVVRAARPGEGRAIARLWRELWDAHEGWGGYAGCHDDRVYDRLGARLDDDARARAGQPILGRHMHVVALVDGVVAGQVEGWVERHGIDPATPYTCEVRSLIVASWARGTGAGRALLAGLPDAANVMTDGASLVLGAEVLERNPAHGFYARLGYSAVSWSMRVGSDRAARVPAASRPTSGSFTARRAEPRDALALSILDATLAERRRALGDVRYDRPRAVDAATVAAIAVQLGESSTLDGGASGSGSAEIVTVDERGRVRAAATFAATHLEPPFLAGRRAVLGRFALDPALDPAEVAAPLIAFGRELAARSGARFLELTELSPAGAPLHAAAVAAGAAPWSRIVIRPFPQRHF
jgi:hypothetical protein